MEYNKMSFNETYYTYKINSVGEYVITSLKVKSFEQNSVMTLSGHNVPYDMIFPDVASVGIAIDAKLQTIKR